MYLVGSSVLNRVESKNYPNNLLGVISQHKQYLGYKSKWYVPTKRSTRIALDLILDQGKNNKVIHFCSPKSDLAQVLKNKLIYTGKYHKYFL